MQRIKTPIRPDYKSKLEKTGFTFHENYWTEGSCYKFTSDEIDMVEKATYELNQMCYKAIDHIIENKLMSLMQIPFKFHEAIEESWKKDDPTLYGRMDFAFDGNNLKLLEYNADTPTSLLEASVIQWAWLEDLYPKKDQFNSIHEELISQWKYIKTKLPMSKVFFTCQSEVAEDSMTTFYLQDVATQAWVDTESIDIGDIGYCTDRNYFIGNNEEQILNVFKLYPWEWMTGEEYSYHLLKNKLNIIEPMWKMLLSTKAILPILWKLYPDHKYLLPTFFSSKPFDDIDAHYVMKPFYSREGANVLIKTDTVQRSEDHGYGEEGFVYQGFNPLSKFHSDEGDVYPVIGSWIVGDIACGMGIRESNNLITTNTSRFVPHYIQD